MTHSQVWLLRYYVPTLSGGKDHLDAAGTKKQILSAFQSLQYIFGNTIIGINKNTVSLLVINILT